MQQGNLAGPIIVAIGVVVGAMAFAVVTTLLNTADSGTELRLSRLETTLRAESEARIRLQAEVAQAKADLARLREDLSLLANRAPVVATPDLDAPPVDMPTAMPDEDFENPPTEGLTEEMLLAKTRFNKGITQPRNRVMMELLGPPRDNYSTDCQPVTNPRLKSLMETRQIGPIKVTMLKPALDSLEHILARLKETDPDIHAKVGTAGAICARFIRGSNTSVSNHSWGTAIDLTLEGQLDPFADGGTQFGLLILAEYFNDEGWYWGAAYNREDSMHFEVGEETLRAWLAEGRL
ncbi:MAG: M15 family metallopeptidase [Gemmobacter sp.]